MITFNPNWIKWISASINKHFSDLISPALMMFVEGEDRKTEGAHDYVELRFNGPDINRLSPNLFRFEVLIDALIVHTKNDQNLYTLEQNIGLVAAAFTSSIPVYEYGNDSTIQFCCLKFKPDPIHNQLVITRFGQSVPSLKLLQASIEGGYEALYPEAV